MNRLRTYLGLEHNIIVMLLTIVLVGMGEELWSRFIPKYLEVLGATAWIIAVYGALRDLLDAIYQYPGGWFTDHFGRKRALVLFAALATIGYLLYLLSSSWMLILIGTVFVMAWSSLTSPAIFAIIGDGLPPQQRSIGFGVQSILKRIPIVVAPIIGGLLMESFGLTSGIHIGLWATILLAFLAIALVLNRYREQETRTPSATGFRKIWRTMNPHLKRLLVADCLARWAEGIPKVFIVLYTMNILGTSPLQFGWLTSIQMIAAIVVYIPIAKLSDKLNRKPFVVLTFAFFALFPLVLALAGQFVWIAIAFIIAGLREVGEPARKAIIVDLAHEAARGRSVGIYYLIRGLVVFPASIIGGWLWTIDYQLPFFVAFGIGLIGFLFYLLFVPSERLSSV